MGGVYVRQLETSCLPRRCSCMCFPNQGREVSTSARTGHASPTTPKDFHRRKLNNSSKIQL
eukprot:1077672-Amphidinium_carterae.1